MSRGLVILLIVFALVWFLIILINIRKTKISIRYSLVWFLMSFVILLVGVFPNGMAKITEFLGFKTVSNFVIGIILTLLLIITLVLTKIVTKQKNQIKLLTQEISLLKEDVYGKK